MKNYILLGVGIGLIISGALFTYLDNKEYEGLREVIRKEVESEFTKEEAFKAIENEFESLIKEEKIEVKEENIEVKEENIEKKTEYIGETKK